MRESKFTQRQAAGILQEAEVRIAVKEVPHKHGINAATFCQWRSKDGVMGVSDVQRLREIEQENARLKLMFTALSLDHSVLKEVLTKEF